MIFNKYQQNEVIKNYNFHLLKIEVLKTSNFFHIFTIRRLGDTSSKNKNFIKRKREHSNYLILVNKN